ncbi:MAG: TRAP transporter large permease, partial [Methanobacteriota archaeon]
MGTELVAIMIIAVLLLLLFAGVPVFASLCLASVLGLYLLRGPEGLSSVPNIFYGKLSHFVLVAVPLFILMGEILFYTGIGEDLYNFGSKWLHRVPGGLAMGTVVASTIFGAMCGVSVAGAATIGSFAIPEMLKRGYDKRLASGCVAASGALAL